MLPEEAKRQRLNVTLDPDVYQFATKEGVKDQARPRVNVSHFVNSVLRAAMEHHDEVS